MPAMDWLLCAIRQNITKIPLEEVKLKNVAIRTQEGSDHLVRLCQSGKVRLVDLCNVKLFATADPTPITGNAEENMSPVILKLSSHEWETLAPFLSLKGFSSRLVSLDLSGMVLRNSETKIKFLDLLKSSSHLKEGLSELSLPSMDISVAGGERPYWNSFLGKLAENTTLETLSVQAVSHTSLEILARNLPNMNIRKLDIPLGFTGSIGSPEKIGNYSYFLLQKGIETNLSLKEVVVVGKNILHADNHSAIVLERIRNGFKKAVEEKTNLNKALHKDDVLPEMYRLAGTGQSARLYTLLRERPDILIHGN